MKAIVWTKYGGPEVLQLQEVEIPVPKEDEVLIKVHAASINSWDRELMESRSIFNLGGRLKPPHRILGCDVAGRVEAVGSNAKLFKVGDEVYGDICGSGWGGFAEYVCARENILALKHPDMTFEEAAATPQAGLMALKALDKGQIKKAKRILINGAGGGVGSFAIQMAKTHGVHITCVDSTDKLDFMRSMGADHVIDHTREDFTKNGQSYDLIIDVISRRSVFEYKRALSPEGICVLIGGSMGKIFQTLFLGSWIIGRRKSYLMLHTPKPDNLIAMNELFESGKVVPVIDKCYQLSEIAEAFRYYGLGQVKGKIVIVVKNVLP